MKEVLLVKHAVGGRTFIHSGQSSVQYSVTTDGDCWTITIHVSPDEKLEELIRWKEELNVFLFREFDNQPTLKIWFYVKDGPVKYDEKLQQLTIQAESRLEYVPSDFGIL